MPRLVAVLILAMFMSLLTAVHAVAEGTATPEDVTKKVAKRAKDDGLPKDFLGLADIRAITNSEITNLERTIRELEESRIPQAEMLEREVTQAKDQISELEKKQPLDTSTQVQLDFLKSRINYSFLSPPVDVLRKRLADAKRSLADRRELARRIQEKIGTLLSPEQEFKWTMSITFAVLIGLVISGFFLIAWHDEKIRHAVFSSEAGMQFLTLFSLVIAIILFGITGILEGKELSALLGGLSGYILGRVTHKG